MMLTEVSRFPLTQYLKPNGDLLISAKVTHDIAYNGHERALFWTNELAIASIDEYLVYRKLRNHGTTTKPSAYRGLDPDQPLFLTSEGKPFGLTKRTTAKGAKSQTCDALGQLVKVLHESSGIEGGTAHSARYTAAVNMAKKYDLAHVRAMLGLQSGKATKRLSTDPKSLGRIVSGRK